MSAMEMDQIQPISRTYQYRKVGIVFCIIFTFFLIYFLFSSFFLFNST